ncbi:hypothetical protein EVAR_72654_1 [Eumeta japonica]|uniref:Uncharacterized protein n=1 Tax=Eumeta variegata TaxID=151549 RepID=A0A4C1T7H2_EUMVA|nr:hypothetical protein EVAR_72654_1 [Eumeta japonica]
MKCTTCSMTFGVKVFSPLNHQALKRHPRYKYQFLFCSLALDLSVEQQDFVGFWLISSVNLGEDRKAIFRI